jgi:hypothetical protein
MNSEVWAGGADFVRRLFFWIERRYGGRLPVDVGDAAQVLVADAAGRRRKGSPLDAGDLGRLFRHEITALVVPGYYDPTAAAQIGAELAKEAVDGNKLRNWKVSTSRGLESSDVSTLGEHPPYNVVAASKDPSMRDAYFDGVLRELQSRRQPPRRSMCAEHQQQDEQGTTQRDVSLPPHDLHYPRLWPLDLLRLELDEAWPGGAGLAREGPKDKSSFLLLSSSLAGPRRPYSGGLPRVMKGPTRWKRGFIHVDEMGPLNPTAGLFSANIYLQLPLPDDEEDDGSSSENKNVGRQPNCEREPTPVLHVWPLGIRSRWDWYRNAVLLSGLSSQDPEMQLRLWNELGAPRTVEVNPGDLVLLCAQRPHCAIGFKRGIRVSLQCFLQYSGEMERLLIDS